MKCDCTDNLTRWRLVVVETLEVGLVLLLRWRMIRLIVGLIVWLIICLTVWLGIWLVIGLVKMRRWWEAIRWRLLELHGRRWRRMTVKWHTVFDHFGMGLRLFIYLGRVHGVRVTAAGNPIRPGLLVLLRVNF